MYKDLKTLVESAIQAWQLSDTPYATLPRATLEEYLIPIAESTIELYESLIAQDVNRATAWEQATEAYEIVRPPKQ